MQTDVHEILMDKQAQIDHYRNDEIVHSKIHEESSMEHKNDKDIRRTTIL